MSPTKKNSSLLKKTTMKTCVTQSWWIHATAHANQSPLSCPQAPPATAIKDDNLLEPQPISHRVPTILLNSTRLNNNSTITLEYKQEAYKDTDASNYAAEWWKISF